MIFRGIIKMTVGSFFHLNTFSYKVRRQFLNQVDEGIPCTLHNKRRISKFCRQHSATTAVTRIQYLKKGTVTKTDMLVFILFGIAYEIKQSKVNGDNYNISCQTLGTLPEQTTAENVRVLESSLH